MSIFAIADLHLSTLESTNKSMEIFGKRWAAYTDKLRTNWMRVITDEDTVVVPGDVSWALTLNEAYSDLKFIDSLPGRKILLKGNHDFWWSTMKKHNDFFAERDIKTISFLFNNAHLVEGMILAGTRGWYHDEDAANLPNDTDFLKLVNRETQRLKFSLDAAMDIKKENPEAPIIAFMHFPPFWNGKESEPIMNLLLSYGVKEVYYGHIHGNYTVEPSFSYKGIKMSIISADYLDFMPKIIKP